MTQQTLNFTSGADAVPDRLQGPIGIFVDGENLHSRVAERIRTLVDNRPEVRLCRVYGNCEHLHDWLKEPGFEIVHTGVAGNGGGETVKNAADVKIAVDVMEFALRENGRTVVLCSSDRDFTPLVWALRRLGVTVVGVGEAKTSVSLRNACHVFYVIFGPSTGPVTPDPVSGGTPACVETKVRKELATYTEGTKGMPLKAFGSAMGQRHKIKVKEHGYKTWREFAQKNPRLCVLIGEGDDTRIKLAGQD